MKTKLLALAAIFLLPLIASAEPPNSQGMAPLGLNAIDVPLISKAPADVPVERTCPQGFGMRAISFYHKSGENLTYQESFGIQCATNTSTLTNNTRIVTSNCSWSPWISKSMLSARGPAQTPAAPDTIIAGIRFSHHKDENLTSQESFPVYTCKVINPGTRGPHQSSTTKLNPASYVSCDPGLITTITFHHDKDNNGIHQESVYVDCYDDPGIADKTANAFNGWLRANKYINASLAVMQNGKFTGQYGFGNRQSSTPVPLASLSKAITAMCIAKLVDRGLLAFGDTLQSRLKSTFPSLSAVDPLAGSITIEQLIRHTSGMVVDPVQTWLAPPPTNDVAADQPFARAALANKLGPRGTAYFYNDVNYALLGLIIKFVPGVDHYDSYCAQAVLTPHPFSDVRIGAGTQGMGAFGGWEMSAEQYADFILKNFTSFSRSSEDFMRRSFASSFDPKYGLGVQIAASAHQRDIWHFGNWNSPVTTPNQFGAFFGYWHNGVIVVATYDKAPSVSQNNDLLQRFRNVLGSP